MLQDPYTLGSLEDTKKFLELSATSVPKSLIKQCDSMRAR